MGWNGGEDGEHQTAEHQEETAIQTHTHTKTKGRLMLTNDHKDKMWFHSKISTQSFTVFFTLEGSWITSHE